VVIVNTFVTRYQYGSHPSLPNYQAIIAEDRKQGNKIFLKSGRVGTLEAALGILVELTGSMVEKVLKRRVAKPLDSETLVQQTTETRAAAGGCQNGGSGSMLSR
jgi:hypothetical protein